MAKSSSGKGKTTSNSTDYSSGKYSYMATSNYGKGASSLTYENLKAKGYEPLSERVTNYLKGQKEKLRDATIPYLDKVASALQYDLIGPLSSLANKSKGLASKFNYPSEGLLARLQMVEYKMRCPKCCEEMKDGICLKCLFLRR